MEPVFMQLGQVAAMAAFIAVKDQVTAQEVDYPKLRKMLMENNLPVVWNPKK